MSLRLKYLFRWYDVLMFHILHTSLGSLHRQCAYALPLSRSSGRCPAPHQIQWPLPCPSPDPVTIALPLSRSTVTCLCMCPEKHPSQDDFLRYVTTMCDVWPTLFYPLPGSFPWTESSSCPCTRMGVRERSTTSSTWSTCRPASPWRHRGAGRSRSTWPPPPWRAPSCWPSARGTPRGRASTTGPSWPPTTGASPPRASGPWRLRTGPVPVSTCCLHFCFLPRPLLPPVRVRACVCVICFLFVFT